jgi:UDP-N-acetylmuramate--alanine ligase
MTHIHFIGIGGTGLSAIARVLLERGVIVTGSDMQDSPLIGSLRDSGASITIGHAASHVLGADIVVRSSAIPDTNIEVEAAIDASIPVQKRRDMLLWLLKNYQVIAVAGTHGKTTTTAMIAWMFTALGMDPSYIVGSPVINLDSNAHAGHDAQFIIEADEYDHMFLGLYPHLAVITNIEHDHPDCFPTPKSFTKAFLDFIGQVEPGGSVLMCFDDPGVIALLEEAVVERVNVIGYGIAPHTHGLSPNYVARNLHINELGGYTFDVYRVQEETVEAARITQVSLRVAGEHNVRNALAAIATAELLGLSPEQAADALKAFKGTSRRFEILGEAEGVTVIDDYAHHPTEIRATLAAARTRYPDNPIWAVWQPHTFSRTRLLFDEFTNSFADADHVLVTEIYPARESRPADGFSSSEIVDDMHHPSKYYASDFDQALQILLTQLTPGDVLLVLSAGDANQLARLVLNTYHNHSHQPDMAGVNING